MTIELVLEDLDGTLIDTYIPLMKIDFQVVNEFTGRMYSYTDYRRIFTPNSDWLEHYRLFGIMEIEKQRQALSRFLDLEETMDDVPKVPGALDFIIKVDSLGMSQHIVTRHERMEIVENKLVKSGLHGHFQKTRVTLTDTDKANDIHNLCIRYNVKPEQTIFISDTAHDIEAGNLAGVKTVAISSKASYDKIDKLRNANPYLLVRNIRSVLNIL